MGFLDIFRKKDVVPPALPPGLEVTTIAALPVTARGERHRFAEYLVEKGLASPDAVRAALMEQKVTKQRVGSILVKNGFLQQQVLIRTILEYNAERIATEKVTSSRIPVEILERHNIIISAETEDTIYVGTMGDEDEAYSIVHEHYPEKEVKFVAFLADNLPDFIERMRRTGSGTDEEDIRQEEMLERLIFKSLKDGASDIHIEPRDSSYSVFMRKLGVRELVHEGSLDEYNTIVSQLKDRSRMDLAERRIGQDGGFQIEYAGKFVDLRVATVAGVNGEQAIVRILDPDRVRPKLDDLGITRVEHWRRGTGRQNGLCLICGATGSGKTTTLNASVRELDRFGKKIYTIEDPVEYRIPFVGQVSTNPQVGLDFARGIRNFMRADPDVIILGEVRDAETARNAVKAADTGHLVLATLHTGSIVSSLSRLRDLGVESYELRYILRSVLVQTLVRTICRHCSGHGVREGVTCKACKGSGYADRTIVSECTSFTDFDEVDRIIRLTDRSGASVSGPLPWPEMIDDAVNKMEEGLTTVDELRRVFGSLVDERCKDRGLDPEQFTLPKHRLLI